MTLTCILADLRTFGNGKLLPYESVAALPCALFGQRILVLIEQQTIWIQVLRETVYCATHQECFGDETLCCVDFSSTLVVVVPGRSGRGGVVAKLSLFRIRVDSKPPHRHRLADLVRQGPVTPRHWLPCLAFTRHPAFLSTTNNSHTPYPIPLFVLLHQIDCGTYTYARKRASQSPFPCTTYHVSVLLTVVNFSWPITVISTCRYQSLFPTRFPRASSYSTTSPLLRRCQKA